MNTTEFFSACKTVAEVKKLYRELAMRWHPDRGGDTATMQTINAQYQKALKRCDGQTTKGDDNRDHTYHYDEAIEAALMEFIDRLIGSGALIQGVNAYLIGTWVWISGNTKAVKGILGKEGLGCEWHHKRQCWYWTPKPNKRHFYSRKGLHELAGQYGASEIRAKAGQSDDERRLA